MSRSSKYKVGRLSSAAAMTESQADGLSWTNVSIPRRAELKDELTFRSIAIPKGALKKDVSLLQPLGCKPYTR
jgi:hypothetical protein